MVYDPYHFEIYHFSDEKRINQSTYKYYEDWRDLEDGRRYECEVMQFTGLKDKNGKEIYEGDIVSFLGETWEVIYFETYAGFMLGNGNDLMNITTQEELIGNIYENPELLTP